MASYLLSRQHYPADRVADYTRKSRSYFRCIALTVAAFPALLIAEDNQTKDPQSPGSFIEELRVLGERDKETLRDESHSVVVFSQDDLKLATQLTFTELFERIPNASVNERGEPVIRGVPQFGIDNGGRGTASTTSLYRDGLGVLVNPVLWDVLTAEVSRGPQNELRPSVSGVLAVGTSDPGDEFNGRARFSLAPDSNNKELGLAVGGPLTENWTGRVSLYSRTDDGHITNTTRNDDAWDSFEETLARFKFTWTPDAMSGTTVKLLAEYTERERGGGTEIRGFGNDPSFNPFARIALQDADTGTTEKAPSFVVDVTHDTGGPWLLNVALGTTSRDEVSLTDGDGTSQPVTEFYTDSELDAIGGVFIAYYRGKDWQIRLRQRVTHLDSAFQQDTIGPFDLDGPGPIPGVQTRTRVEVPWPDFYSWTSQISVARSFERLRFAGSLAYEGDTTGEDFSLESVRLTSTGVPPFDAFYDTVIRDFAPQVIGKVDTRSHDLLPMLSLSWSVNDRSIVGMKWERARRAGGVTVNIARKALDTYQPETADNLDLFFKATGFNDQLSVAGNLFYSRISDLQLNAALTNLPQDNQVVNAKRAHTSGLEIELALTQLNWHAFLAAGLLNAKLDDINVGTTDLSGNRYPFAPRWSITTGASYDKGQGLFASFDLSHQPDSQGAFDNRAGTLSESRTLLNARTGWRFGRTSISLFARNLLDDRYHIYRDLGLPTGLVQVFNPGDPREIGITAEIDW